MPLEENLNSLCGDKSLEDKIHIYERSNFTTARNVANRYADNAVDFTINSRGSAMADDLYNEISRIVNAI